MSDRAVVLIGFTGSGKTTFFNKICNTNQPATYGGIPITKQTFLKEAAYGSGFRVLDTPGFGSKSEKIIHAVSVLNALSEGPVNQILLIVKFERILQMQDYIKNMVAKFLRYKHLLTVTVTHWDNVDKSTIKQNQEQVINLCKRFGINSVIFVSKKDSGESICAKIDSIINHCQAENVQLTEAEFYSNFDLIELKEDIELELDLKKEQVAINFKKISQIIKKFIKEFDDNNPQLHEIMHQLILETKKIAENLISDFERKNNDKFSQLFEYYQNPRFAYLIYFQLKKELMKEIDSIIKLAQEKMISDKNHCFNFIKPCPYCGIIWLKVYGSDGQTFCGKFPNEDDQIFSKYQIPQKYTFTITEQGINYTLNQPISTIENSATKKYYIEPSPKEKRLGCGKTFIWHEIPSLSKEQLNELFDPGLMEQKLQKNLIKTQMSLYNQLEQIIKEIRLLNF